MKLYRNIIIMVLIVAVLGAGYYFVYKFEPEKEEEKVETSFKSEIMLKNERENIKNYRREK